MVRTGMWRRAVKQVGRRLIHHTRICGLGKLNGVKSRRNECDVLNLRA